MFFPANYSCPGKEEFAGNALQNGGNRRGSLHSHRRKPAAVTAWRRKHGKPPNGIKGMSLVKQGFGKGRQAVRKG